MDTDDQSKNSHPPHVISHYAASGWAVYFRARQRSASMKNGKVNVAIIGLGFGAEIIPIYQKHPNVNMYGICQRTKSKLDQIGDAFGIGKRYADYNHVIHAPEADVVRINSTIPEHA